MIIKKRVQRANKIHVINNLDIQVFVIPRESAVSGNCAGCMVKWAFTRRVEMRLQELMYETPRTMDWLSDKNLNKGVVVVVNLAGMSPAQKRIFMDFKRGRLQNNHKEFVLPTILAGCLIVPGPKLPFTEYVDPETLRQLVVDDNSVEIGSLFFDAPRHGVRFLFPLFHYVFSYLIQEGYRNAFATFNTVIKDMIEKQYGFSGITTLKESATPLRRTVMNKRAGTKEQRVFLPCSIDFRAIYAAYNAHLA